MKQNEEKLFNRPNATPFVKDIFHDAVIQNKNITDLQKKKQGTKCSPVYATTIQGNSSYVVNLRLTNTPTDNPICKRF